jgi:gas vesicle protein
VLLSAPDQEFVELAPHLGDLVGDLKKSTENLGDAITSSYDSARALGPSKSIKPLSLIPGSDFPGRDEFKEDWSFEVTDPGAAPTGDGTPQTRTGRCVSPGPTNKLLIETQRDEIISGAVKTVAERFCEQTVLGVNVSAACIITDVVYYAFKAINESQNLCGDLAGRADTVAIYDGLQHVHNDLQNLNSGFKADINNTVSAITNQITTTSNTITNQIATTKGNIESSITQTRNEITTAISATENNLKNEISDTETHLSTTISVAEKGLTDLVTQRSDSIDSSLGETAQFIAEFRAENLRLHIEANLADEGKPIASFQAPSNYRGYLELVDRIVRETLDRMSAAGQSVSNAAESQYRRASEFFAVMNYEEAYKWYGMAYQSAVK